MYYIYTLNWEIVHIWDRNNNIEYDHMYIVTDVNMYEYVNQNMNIVSQDIKDQYLWENYTFPVQSEDNIKQYNIQQRYQASQQYSNFIQLEWLDNEYNYQDEIDRTFRILTYFHILTR